MPKSSLPNSSDSVSRSGMLRIPEVSPSEIESTLRICAIPFHCPRTICKYYSIFADPPTHNARVMPLSNKHHRNIDDIVRIKNLLLPIEFIHQFRYNDTPESILSPNGFSPL
jgi:hypothetical protein